MMQSSDAKSRRGNADTWLFENQIGTSQLVMAGLVPAIHVLL